MKYPYPALYAAVLHALSSTAPRSRSMTSTMNALAEGISTTNAQCLPEAIGEVLRLLRGDTERLHFAAEIALRLSYFESAAAVTSLALATGDRRLLLTAATLCGNPAVPAEIRARVFDSVRNDPVGRIRLDHTATPTTADEKLLYLQCWPGARSTGVPSGLAPVVVLDRGFDARDLLRIALRLDEAGAVVLRLTPSSTIPFWFGSETVLICKHQTRTRVLSDVPGVS